MPAALPRPLDGVTVVDFTTLLPGPLATLMLAEAGARVVKIERPGGEDMRRFPPFDARGSIPYRLLNRGKEIRELDLKDPVARAEVEALIAGADVLVEQFRPGVMDRLGLGWEAVRQINPRLVYCSISGYGQSGPRALEAGHDLNYQAVTGLLALSPGRPDRPNLPPTLSADIAGGALPAVINILLALLRRERTGTGAHLDIAMADNMFVFAPFALADVLATGAAPPPGGALLTGGRPRYGLYATADERLVALGALEDKFWLAFCDLIGLPETLRADDVDPDATRAAVAARLAARSAADWRPVFAAADCCATIVASLDEALADPHLVARGLFAPRDGETVLPIPIAPGLR